MERHTLVLPNGERITSATPALPALRSVRVTETVNAGYDLTLGSVCAAMLEAELLAPEGVSLGAGDEVTLYRGDTPVGVFRIERPQLRRGGIVALTGYDRVIRLDRDVTGWFYELRDWPYTLQDFAAMVCEACEVTLVGHIPGGERQVPQFVCTAVTGRQLLQWVGEAAGQFLRADPEGSLRFGWYEASDRELAPTGDSFYYQGTLDLTDTLVEPVDRVLRQGETGGENPYTLSYNPLLPPDWDLTALQERFFSYQPCTVTVPTALGLRAGQVVAGEDSAGRSFRFLVMKRISNGSRDILSCTGSRSRVSSEAVNTKTPAQLAQQAVDRQSQQDIFNKLTDGGRIQGIYMEDGQLYINASYLKAGTLDASLLQTGIIRSADGTVELDLGSNMVTIHGTYALNGISYPTKTTLSANGLQGWGQDAFGELVETLSLQPGVSGGSTMLMNLYGDGLTVAAMAGVTTLGTTTSTTELLGSDIQLYSIGTTEILADRIRIGGKTVSWRDNGNGTYTLIGT